MYNLSNSPPGPLGGAGMASNSTQPSGLFTNAGPSFNNFGKGLDSFTTGLRDKLGALMEKINPSPDGGMGSEAPQAPGWGTHMANGASALQSGFQGNDILGVGFNRQPGMQPPGGNGIGGGVLSLFGKPEAGQQQGAPTVGGPNALASPLNMAPQAQGGITNNGPTPGNGALSRFM